MVDSPGESESESEKLPAFRNVLGKKLGATRFGGREIPGGETVADEIASRLIEGALGGDLKFIKEVFDRYEGRPRPIDPARGGGVDARDAMERLSEAEEIVRVRRAEESQGGP